MKCEVLVSTMNQSNCVDLINEMKINNCVVINQVTEKNIELENINSSNYKIVSCRERGLSKSRNKAIENSTADICLIADDDMFYYENYEKIVIDAYKEFPEADLIAFIVTHDNRKTKKILKPGEVDFINSNRIQSVQLTFKRKNILSKNVKFDEIFGAGAKYNFGEENIFINDCRKNGLKLYFKPIVIANLKDTGCSTWFRGFNDNYFISRGAVYKRLSPKLYYFMIFQFAIRKYNKYKNENTLINAIKMMFKGAKQYGG